MKFQLVMTAEEKLGKNKGRILAEALIGEYDSEEEVTDAFDDAADQLDLEEADEDEDGREDD